MSIQEIKLLKSVEVLPQVNAVNVLWENNIVKDGEVIASNMHRCAYGKGQREKFLEEIEDSEKYVELIDWTVEVVDELPND